MTNDIHLAFAHPSERAAASTDVPYDRISVRDYVVEVEIGAFQQERGTRQRVRFNVVVEVLPVADPVDDDVDKILSYDKVTEAIAIELEAERINLLETLAARVAERILIEPQAERVFVRIEKLDRGPFALGVEIVRASDGAQPAAQDHIGTPHPRVVYLSNAAMGSPGLSAWIDTLTAQPDPLIFCVGQGAEDAPQTGHLMTQRRVDLLAIEQNAWVLAAKDLRCKVVATRTELDWAMKNGQVCVWAPSKIVLDAVDGPTAGPQDAVALSGWFATEMQAKELLVVGDALPQTVVPARAIAIGEAL